MLGFGALYVMCRVGFPSVAPEPVKDFVPSSSCAIGAFCCCCFHCKICVFMNFGFNLYKVPDTPAPNHNRGNEQYVFGVQARRCCSAAKGAEGGRKDTGGRQADRGECSRELPCVRTRKCKFDLGKERKPA